MAYIDELLSQDEQVLYEGRQHAFVLIGNIVTEMLLIAILIAAGVASQRYLTNVRVAGQPGGTSSWPPREV